MTIRMSTKGQIVVPKEIRERAGIDAGDELDISLENGKILLKKTGPAERTSLRIKINKRSGLPYFDVPKNAPAITDEWVKEQLAHFP